MNMRYRNMSSHAQRHIQDACQQTQVAWYGEKDVLGLVIEHLIATRNDPMLTGDIA